MTIHYHGLPIWGGSGEVCKIAIGTAGAFVSYVRPDQIRLAFQHADSVAIDNGAFSYWKSNKVPDWTAFYKWLDRFYNEPKLSFFVIPDVIEGGEADNDRLISTMPVQFIDKASPVWHLHESIERLVRLCENWPRVCLGSSGEYAVIRTKKWHARMKEAFIAIKGIEVKLHGLRMLDGRVLGAYPLDSADSTNLACNVPKTEVKHPEITRHLRSLGCSDLEVKKGRCAILKSAIEKVKPPTRGVYYEQIERGL